MKAVAALLVASAIGAFSAPVPLTPNVPAYGQLDRFYSDYYVYDVSGITNYIGITLTMTAGDCSLYVGANYIPSLSNYTYKNDTHTGNTRDILIVNPSSPHYYIQVYGYSTTTCTYNIRAGSQGVTTMTDGVIYSGSVPYGAFYYYQFQVPQNVEDMTLILDRTSTYGDPDEYVALGYLPTTQAYGWKQTANTQTICLFWKLPAAGTYYYGVYGYAAADYRTELLFNNQNVCAFQGTIQAEGDIHGIVHKVSAMDADLAQGTKFVRKVLV